MALTLAVATESGVRGHDEILGPRFHDQVHVVHELSGVPVPLTSSPVGYHAELERRRRTDQHLVGREDRAGMGSTVGFAQKKRYERRRVYDDHVGRPFSSQPMISSSVSPLSGVLATRSCISRIGLSHS